MKQKTKVRQISALERQLAARAAIASVQAEGLEPSPYTRARLEQYVRGEISVSQLRRDTLSKAKTAG